MKAIMNLRNNQSGLVSIVVALVIMSILTLVAVSFAFLTRREQRQSLDRQLSTQAFYAAETGVNDAIAALPALGAGTTIDDCDDASQNQIESAANSSAELDADGVIAYTCVLINRSPTTLEYNKGISEDSSTVVRVQTPKNVDSLMISWEELDTTNFTNEQFSDSNGKYYLPQDRAMKDQAVGAFFETLEGQHTAQFPNNIGMLRATIIPTNAASSADSLLRNSQNIFFYPDKSNAVNTPGTVSFRTSQQRQLDGTFASGQCNVANGRDGAFADTAPRDCNTVVENVGLDDFYLRLRSIYRPVAVTITPLDTSGEPLEISGGQVLIDATGRANDVLRRIQVRVPYRNDYYFPEFAVESAESICKRIRTTPTGVEVMNPADAWYPPTGEFNLGEFNDRDKDIESCRIPSVAKPY